MKIKVTLSTNSTYLLFSFLIGLIIFSLFRTSMYLIYAERLTAIVDSGSLVAQSMVMGLRFDIVISCYIIVLPLLLSIIADYVKCASQPIMRIVRVYVTVFYCVAFTMCLIDIPFFEQFNLRLNNVALTWLADSPSIVLGMLFTEASYLIYFLLFIVFVVGYVLLQRLIWRKTTSLELKTNKIFMAIVYLILICLLAIGIRGRLSKKSPIRVGTAYFSSYSFVNQMSLNPVFFFMRTVMDAKKNNIIKLVDSSQAIDYVSKEFGCSDNLERIIQSDSAFSRRNVVVIILESMSSLYLKTDSSLVPNLKSLRDKSLYFPNIYSGGIHTFNGIYSTLFSYPGYMHHHTMKESIVNNLGSMTSEFKANNYHTMFFVPHDDQFDNIAGFLFPNDITTIVSQKDYPQSEVKTTLGVPDHVMFDRTLIEYDKSYEKGENFISFVLTVSNHAPYYLPTDIDFKPTSNGGLFTQMVEYSDWTISDFLNKASTKKWFDNTLFIILADHGRSSDGPYNISLTYNNIPLMFYAPNFITPSVNENFGCQSDALPTAAGLLNMSYTNRTFGVDLLREKRPYSYFCADNKIAAMDHEWLYLYDEFSGEYLYRLSENGPTNHINDYRETADSMRNYAFSMTQAAYNNSKKVK